MDWDWCINLLVAMGFHALMERLIWLCSGIIDNKTVCKLDSNSFRELHWRTLVSLTTTRVTHVSQNSVAADSENRVADFTVITNGGTVLVLVESTEKNTDWTTSRIPLSINPVNTGKNWTVSVRVTVSLDCHNFVPTSFSTAARCLRAMISWSKS